MKIPFTLRSDFTLAAAGVLLILLVIALERFPGERWWPTLLLVYMPQQVWLMPPIILTVYMIIRHKWWLAVISIVPVAFVLIFLIGMSLPQASPKMPSQLRILTWNLYYGRGGSRLPELFTQTMPDIICLQEADPWAQKHLDEMLSRPQFRGWSSKVCGELVILSRFPLKRLGTTHSALWAAADVDGEEVVIANTHFAVPFKPRLSSMTPGNICAADDLRMKQATEILNELPADVPVIVCGDFNTPPNTRIYRMLGSHMTNAFKRRGQGLGLSYKRELPMVRIDHIFSKGSIEPVQCWMPKIDASNHRPMCADFSLYGADNP
ncbi:MAG: endonuclease/exonuclease/phosphatase family protein [Armatimonadota bacterium]